VSVFAHTDERLAEVVMPISTREGIVGATQVGASKESDVIALEKYEVLDRKPFTDENVDIVRTMNDAQPYYIFESRTIERSGALNLEDFLKQRLTMDTTAQTTGQNGGSTLGARAA